MKWFYKGSFHSEMVSNVSIRNTFIQYNKHSLRTRNQVSALSDTTTGMLTKTQLLLHWLKTSKKYKLLHNFFCVDATICMYHHSSLCRFLSLIFDTPPRLPWRCHFWMTPYRNNLFKLFIWSYTTLHLYLCHFQRKELCIYTKHQ